MKKPPASTLDEVIADYLQKLDEGERVDPVRFIENYPAFREDFLKFISETDRVANWTDRRGWCANAPLDFTEPSQPWLLDGYRIEQKIGRGGMANVYRARHVDGDPEVALKVVDTGSAGRISARQRFRREADAIQTLDHDHIVPLLDYGTSGDYSYLALQLIHGCTLAEWIHAEYEATIFAGNHSHPLAGAEDTISSRSGSASQPSMISNGSVPQPSDGIPPTGPGTAFESDEQAEVSARRCFQASRVHGDFFKDIAELVATACDALQAAHDKGIIHRDIKPSNLMLDRVGKLWLTDFGLASLSEATTVVTTTGQLIGTPCYMSPEQASGNNQSVDRRSDVYSIGSTLYELVTGQRCFAGDRVSVLMELANGKITPPSKVRPDIPRALEAIILKAMAFTPSDRYQSAAEMAADLRRFAAGLRTLARRPTASDRAIRWLTANPKTSISVLVGVAAFVLLVLLIQFSATRRLNHLNHKLAGTNRALERSNDQLIDSNRDLDRSQRELHRHLYVADMAAAYRAYGQQDFDAVNQILARHEPRHSEHAPGSGPASVASASSPFPQRGQGDGAESIGTSSEQLRSVDRRGFEWWLLRNLTRRPAAIELEAHPDGANELALLPDGQSFLSVGSEGRIRQWDVESGASLNEWNIGGRLDAIAVSPDGGRLITGSNVPEGLNPVTLRRARDGRVMKRLTGHNYSVESAAFSPNGNWVATAGRYNDVLLHDSEGRLRGKLLTGSRNESLEFSPDGRSLLAVHRKKADGQTRQTLRRLSVPDLEPVFSWEFSFDPVVFCFSAKGTRLAAANDDSWVVVSANDASAISMRENIRGRIRCLALDEKGEQVAAGCDNGLIYIWDLNAEGRNHETSDPKVITDGTTKVTDLVFSDPERLIAAGEDGTVQVWSLNRMPVRHPVVGGPTLAIATRPVDAERLFIRKVDGGIVRLELATLQLRHVADLSPDRYGKLSVSTDEQWLAAAGQGELGIFETTEGALCHRIESDLRGGNCHGLRFVDEDRHLLALFNDRLRRYACSTWKLVDEVMLPEEGGGQLLVSHDQSTLLVLAKDELCWFDAETLEIVGRRPRQFGDYTWAGYSVDDRIIAVGHQAGTIELLRTGDRTRLRLLQGHRDSICGLIFIDNDRTLISTSTSGMIRFWDVASGRELGQLKMGKSRADMIHFSQPSQSLFAFGLHYPFKVWSGERSQ